MSNTEKPDKMLAYIRSPEGKAEIQAFWKQRVQEQSGENGYCTADGCGGLIVKKVHGLCSIGYTYSLPYCSKCGRQYIFAEGYIPTVGHKEFEELMNKPFTI